MEKTVGGRGKTPVTGYVAPQDPLTPAAEQTGQPRPRGTPRGQLPAAITATTDAGPPGGGRAQVTPRGVGALPPILPQPSQPLSAQHSFTKLKNGLSTFIAGIGRLPQELDTVNRERARIGAICRVINDCNTHKKELRILCHAATDDPSQAGVLRGQARQAIRRAVREACLLLGQGRAAAMKPSVICQFANGIRGLRDCRPFDGTAESEKFDNELQDFEALLLRTIRDPAVFQPPAPRWKPKEYAQVIIALPTIPSASGPDATFDPSVLFGSVTDKRDPPDDWDAWGFANTLDALGSLVSGKPQALGTDQVSGVAIHMVSRMVDVLATSTHNDFTPLDCRQTLNALLQLRRAGVNFGEQGRQALQLLLNQIANLGGSGAWTARDVLEACRTLRSLLDEGFLSPNEAALRAAMDTLMPLSFTSDNAFRIACDIQGRINASAQPAAKQEPDPGEAGVAAPREKQERKKAAPTERSARGRGAKVPVRPRHQHAPEQGAASSALQRLQLCKTTKELCTALSKDNAPAALAAATTGELLGLWRRLLNEPGAEDAVTVLAQAMHDQVANLPADKLPQCVSALTTLVRKSPADEQLAAIVSALAERIRIIVQTPCQLGWICDIVTAWASLAKLMPETLGPMLKSAEAATATAGKTLQAEKFDFTLLSTTLRALARLSAVEDEPALLDDFIQKLAKRIEQDKSPKGWSKTGRTQAALDIAMLGPNSTQLPELLNTLVGKKVVGANLAKASQIVYELMKDSWTVGAQGITPVMTTPPNTSAEVVSMFVCGIYDAADSTKYIPIVSADTPEGVALIHDAERTWLMSRAETLSDPDALFDDRVSAFQKMIVAVGRIYQRQSQNGTVELTAKERRNLAAPLFRFISTVAALPEDFRQGLFIAQPINNLMFLYKAIHAVLEKPDILELLDWPTLNAVKRVQEAIRGSVSHSKKGQSEQGQAIDSIHRFLDEGYPEIEKRLPPIKPTEDDQSSDDDAPIDGPIDVAPAQAVTARPSTGPRRIEEVLVFFGPGVLPGSGLSEQDLREQFQQAAGPGMKVKVVGDGQRPLSTNDLTGLAPAPSSSAIVLMRQPVKFSDTHLLSYSEQHTWKTSVLLDTLRKKGVKEFHVFAKADDLLAGNIRAQPRLLDSGKVTCNVYGGQPVSAVDTVSTMIRHHAQGNLVEDADSDGGKYVREHIAQDTRTRVHSVSIDPASNTVKDEVFPPAQ